MNNTNCRMTGGVCDCRSGGSYGGCAKERGITHTNIQPAPYEPRTDLEDPTDDLFIAVAVGQDRPGATVIISKMVAGGLAALYQGTHPVGDSVASFKLGAQPVAAAPAPEQVPSDLMEQTKEQNAAFNRMCGKFYQKHNRLPAPVEIFVLAQQAAPVQAATEFDKDLKWLEKLDDPCAVFSSACATWLWDRGTDANARAQKWKTSAQQAEAATACPHEFQWFGDQVGARRCVHCNKLEGKAEAAPAPTADTVNSIVRDVCELDYTGENWNAEDMLSVTLADLRLICERHIAPVGQAAPAPIAVGYVQGSGVRWAPDATKLRDGTALYATPVGQAEAAEPVAWAYECKQTAELSTFVAQVMAKLDEYGLAVSDDNGDWRSRVRGEIFNLLYAAPVGQAEAAEPLAWAGLLDKLDAMQRDPALREHRGTLRTAELVIARRIEPVGHSAATAEPTALQNDLAQVAEALALCEPEDQAAFNRIKKHIGSN